MSAKRKPLVTWKFDKVPIVNWVTHRVKVAAQRLPRRQGKPRGKRRNRDA